MINHQEDAHEFLQSFLDKLERCCLDPKNQLGSVSSQDLNIVDNVFGGGLMSTVRYR
jgi:ubiquitin carboxyl-terminal hydrolase 36/42